MKTLFSALALAILLVTSASAFEPPVVVTTCGQVVPKRATAILMAALDCRGLTDGPAIRLEKGASLDLRGNHLSGGQVGIACLTACALSGPDCFVPTKCSVRNGTVENSQQSGIVGGDLTIDDVTATNHPFRGIDGGRRVKLTGSTITNNGNAGVVADRLKITGSTITGNGVIGLGSIVATVRESTVVDNDASTSCTDPKAPPWYDIGTERHPRLRDTTCKHSFALTDQTPPNCTDGSWCVCSGDQQIAP
jgi:hypothetical protein